jgi:hypothetical protein
MGNKKFENEVISKVSITLSEGKKRVKNCQISIFGFQCLTMNIEE